MIDKYLLEDLSLRRDEKGDLARWIIQLQADVDTERRKSASLESVIYARDTRIAELEVIRTDAAQVFKEIGNELGCNPDNESIMMAIYELKAIKSAGEKLVRCKGRYHSEQNYRALAALFGVTTPYLPPVDGDSEAVIAELRAKLATPVRLKKVDSSNVPYAGDGFNAAVDYCADRVRAAGFTVEGDE